MRAAAALLLLAACTPDFRVVGDPMQPLDLDLSTGVPQTRIRGRTMIAAATVDTGSPVSTLSNLAGCGPDTAMVLNSAAVPDRVRLAFPDLHPYCVDGESVLGGDLLVHYEAIFAGDRCGASALGCLQLAPHEVESTLALSQERAKPIVDASGQLIHHPGWPFAVISFRLLGGGTFVDSSGRTLSWPATRVPLRVCINPPQKTGDPPGVDATLLVATGREPLQLTASAKARIGTDVFDHLVLMGQTMGGSIQDPGPCGEFTRALCLDAINPRDNRDARQLACEKSVLTDPDSLDNTADVGAWVMLDGPMMAQTLADDDPYIQAARNEVRPRIADVDGVIGAQILARLEQVRIDYQGDPGDDIDSSTRFITRCKLGDPTCHLSARHGK